MLVREGILVLAPVSQTETAASFALLTAHPWPLHVWSRAAAAPEVGDVLPLTAGYPRNMLVSGYNPHEISRYELEYV